MHPIPAYWGTLATTPKRLPAGARPSRRGGWETGALGRVAEVDPKRVAPDVMQSRERLMTLQAVGEACAKQPTPNPAFGVTVDLG